MEFKVLNIIRDGKYTNEPLKIKFWGLIAADNHKNLNVSFVKHFKPENFITYDVLVNDREEIVTSCGIMRNNDWPDHHFRILSRVYLSKNFRVSKYSYLCTKYILPLQMKTIESKFNFIFFSRAGLYSKNFFKKWMSENNFVDWKISNRFIHLSAKSNDVLAYQRICYFTLGDDDFCKNGIDEFQYRNMFFPKSRLSEESVSL